MHNTLVPLHIKDRSEIITKWHNIATKLTKSKEQIVDLNEELKKSKTQTELVLEAAERIEKETQVRGRRRLMMLIVIY